ncbi:MAG: histidine phosphatase family protein [Chloracidobacterium sp.]|nr:histidine phosphatase family protein [Chloracidobacterium sp.]
MKTLFLMRHAKSSWNDASIADFDRPLNDRGERTAPFMGRFMREKGFEPSMIISSPAVRAKCTAQLVKDAAGFLSDLKFDERIYDAHPQALLQVVSEIDNSRETAMLVGHNPGIEGFIRFLTGDLEPMPTAALAVIDLNIDSWNDVADGCGKLKCIFRPRDLTPL